MSAVMILRVFLMTVLFCGSLTAPMKPGATNRGMFHAFQDIFGGGMNMMMGAAGGLSQMMDTGMGTAMNMFGDFSPSQWNPFASNTGADLANALSSAMIKPPTETTVAPTVAPTRASTTSATPKYHWIVLGRK